MLCESLPSQRCALGYIGFFVALGVLRGATARCCCAASPPSCGPVLCRCASPVESPLVFVVSRVNRDALVPNPSVLESRRVMLPATSVALMAASRLESSPTLPMRCAIRVALVTSTSCLRVLVLVRPLTVSPVRSRAEAHEPE